MNWQLIDREKIPEVWPNISAGIERALLTSNGEATPEDTRDGLAAGRTQLALLNDGEGVLGVVFMILAFPRYKIARVLLLFGTGMKHLRNAIRLGEQWAKSQGCRYVEAWVATQSRARLFSRFGYGPAYAVLRRPL